MAKRKRTKKKKTVETLTHEEASRKNIPTAELESVVPARYASSYFWRCLSSS
jgi:adenine-specific DNA-methyltransferase